MDHADARDARTVAIDELLKIVREADEPTHLRIDAAREILLATHGEVHHTA